MAKRGASTTDDGRPRVNAVLIVPHAPAAAQVRALGWTKRIAKPGPFKGVRHVTTLDEISALTRPNHPDDWTELDSAAVDTVRVLAADAVQKVGNGHPGTAMSLAPLAYTLFQRQMRHDPSDTHWLGRDRFVLSARAFQPDPVHPAVPRRVRARAGRHRVAADLEVQDTGASRVPAHHGRRDHHRPAGPGPGLGGRDGDGVALRARSVRSGRGTGHQPVRPLHLRDRLGRRHGGGRDQRGVVAGGHPATRAT